MRGDSLLAVRIPEELETRLEELAKLTGRPKSYYVREALTAHLDDMEDTYTSLYRLEHPAKRWTLEDLEQGRDLGKQRREASSLDRRIRRPRPARVA